MKIGIIGCGNMGEAILRQNKITAAFDRDAKKNAAVKKRYNVEIAFDIRELVRGCDVVIIAVKPQDIDGVLDEIREALSHQLLVSIAAGIGTRYIEDKIGGKAKVIRVMPNMAASVKSGISAVCKGRFSKNSDLAAVEKIFATLGKVKRIQEKYLDGVTAIAGSGPAYFFYFIEALTAAGRKLGFSEKAAVEFVKEVAKGSIKLLEETGLPAKELRERVTSKGGTTEAALNVFKHEKLNKIIVEAVRRAARRACELSRS